MAKRSGWICPSCTPANGSNLACGACGASAGHWPQHPGDVGAPWLCTCQCLNLGNRSLCELCGNPGGAGGDRAASGTALVFASSEIGGAGAGAGDSEGTEFILGCGCHHRLARLREHFTAMTQRLVSLADGPLVDLGAGAFSSAAGANTVATGTAVALLSPSAALSLLRCPTCSAPVRNADARSLLGHSAMAKASRCICACFRAELDLRRVPVSSTNTVTRGGGGGIAAYFCITRPAEAVSPRVPREPPVSPEAAACAELLARVCAVKRLLIGDGGWEDARGAAPSPGVGNGDARGQTWVCGTGYGGSSGVTPANHVAVDAAQRRQ